VSSGRNGFRIHVTALVAVTCATPAAAETIRVRVADLAFTPVHVSAHAGDTIEWVSDDFVAHTATARDGQWDVFIPAGGTGQIKLGSVGSFRYFCRFHPNMSGQIAVGAER
jgi:plastocyanin